MDVSVIIPTRNTAALTAGAVRAALAANGVTTEILVVDNGSTDDTKNLLEREFPQIRVLRSEKNLGFARACNWAARESSGEFILLLNSDARPEPDAMLKSIQCFQVNPRCAVIGGQLLHDDGARQNSIANFPTLATELLNKSLLRRIWPKRFPGKETIFESPVEVESVIGAFFLVRRSVWQELGRLDERFFFFLEETDFCLRAKIRGSSVMHVPQARIRHGQGVTAKQVSCAARIEYWRSRYLYFQKHFGLASRIFLRAFLLVRLFINWLAAMIVVVFTFGQNLRSRSRLKVYSALLAWHLRGCPDSAGLPR